MPIPIILWNKTTSGFNLTEDGAITALCEFNGKLYAGTFAQPGFYAKVYESTDGINWSVSKTFSIGGPVYSMCVHDDGGGNDLYVCHSADAHIWKFDSTTWTEIAGANLGTGDFLLTANQPSQMVSYGGKLHVTMYWASTPRKPVWSSIDGITWAADSPTSGTIISKGGALIVYGGDLYLGGIQATSPNRTYIYKKSSGTWGAGTELVESLGGTTLRTKEFVDFNGDLWAVCDGASAADIHIYQLNGGTWTQRAIIVRNDPGYDLEGFSTGIGFVGQPDGMFRAGNVQSGDWWAFSRSSDGSTWGVFDEIYQETVISGNKDNAHPHTFTTFGGYQFFGGGWNYDISSGNSAAIWTDKPLVVAPVADFTSDVISGLPPLTVNFTDLSTNIPTSWLWDFGDPASGPLNTSTLQSPSHIYTSAGTYTVTLTATNAGGFDTEIKTDYITAALNPVADFTSDVISGLPPLIVNFTDTSTNVPTSWLWDFGDPASGLLNTSTLQDPTHIYSAPGTYTVSLIATNAGGFDTEIKTDYITVNTPIPVADFTGVPTSGVFPLTVNFTDLSTNTPTSWLWDFGDPASGLLNTSTLQNPTHIYTSIGTYTVSLTATNAGGFDTEIKTNYITATPVPIAASYTKATPAGRTTLQNEVVQLKAYLNSGHTIPDSTARIYWQRYAQSSPGVFNIAQRSNLAGRATGCINICYFDPDKVVTKLYHAPGECDPISYPILKTDADLQLAYQKGDFSILIEGYDAVSDLGFGIKSLYHDNGTPIAFLEFLPGNIYIDPNLGMFVFFHFPDYWDNSCSHWEFAWWDTNSIPIVGVNTTLPPYVTDWNTLVSVPAAVPSYAPRDPDLSPLPKSWDGETSPGSGWAQPSWSDTNDPIPINSYWNVVSEAPMAAASIVVSYWTQDNTDPLEPRGGGTPNESYNYRNELYTSPITMATDTQLRFRSVNITDTIEDTRTETYIVGMRLALQQGINLISQPYYTTSPNNALAPLCAGLDVLQVFRLDYGLWQAFVPGQDNVYDINYYPSAFEIIDNQHGLFFIMNSPGTFCFPYGANPLTTELDLVSNTTNQGINAIAVPRASSEDNSIDNLLLSRQIEFMEIHRVTNNIFETYILDRAPVLNFNPADLTPGRGYGIVAPRAQTFELPFTD